MAVCNFAITDRKQPRTGRLGSARPQHWIPATVPPMFASFHSFDDETSQRHLSSATRAEFSRQSRAVDWYFENFFFRRVPAESIEHRPFHLSQSSIAPVLSSLPATPDDGRHSSPYRGKAPRSTPPSSTSHRRVSAS